MVREFLSSEWKKWTRDPMMSFMLVYPLLFGVLGRYVLPWAAESNGFPLAGFADIALILLTLMTPIVYGALVGFSILDDRDDNVLPGIRVSPLTIHAFLGFRLALVTGLSLLACAFVMWFSNLAVLTGAQIWGIAFLASWGAPLSGLLINAFAKNKIEGFAIMKGTGIVVLFPILALFFSDYRELFFAFVPSFWPGKAISVAVRGEGFHYLSYAVYYWVGLVFHLAVTAGMYALFLRKMEDA